MYMALDAIFLDIGVNTVPASSSSVSSLAACLGIDFRSCSAVSSGAFDGGAGLDGDAGLGAAVAARPPHVHFAAGMELNSRPSSDSRPSR